VESGTKQRLWQNLRDYQEDLIVRRFGAALENCLHDLGVSPSTEELQQLRLLSTELARSPAVSRGIRNSCQDIWDRLYRKLYGAPPDFEPAEAPVSKTKVSGLHSAHQW
jgi:hypothetical protein